MSYEYQKAMAVGAKTKKINELKEEISEWNEIGQCRLFTEIIVNAIDYKNNETTIEEMMVKIAKAINKDEGYDEYSRGFIAGEMIGEPNEDNLDIASTCEEIWENDKNGKYGYYQEVIDRVMKG